MVNKNESDLVSFSRWQKVIQASKSFTVTGNAKLTVCSPCLSRMWYFIDSQTSGKNWTMVGFCFVQKQRKSTPSGSCDHD